MTLLYTPVPAQDDVMTALRSFLISILPAGIEIVQAEESRVPEPDGADFIVLTPLLRERLGTNVDVYADCAFAGSVSGSSLTVASVQFGTIQIGAPLFGAGVAAGALIQSQATGTAGGVGSYTLSAPQTGVSGVLAAGVRNIVQPSQLTVQIDIHSADVSDAADMAQTISTLMRSDVAVDAFAASSPKVSPLYATDPRQMPFMNAEQQYETRWVLDAMLQAEQSIPAPQQFAASVTINFFPADIVEPA